MPPPFEPLAPALRFVLELVGITAIALAASRLAPGLAGPFAAAGTVIVIAGAWAAFRVPGDPGPAPVAVSGPARLALEAVVFALATASLALVAGPAAAAVFGAAVLVQYALDRGRIRRLLGHR